MFERRGDNQLCFIDYSLTFSTNIQVSILCNIFVKALFPVSKQIQDDCHKAVNLVTSNGSKVWLSNRKDTSGKSEVILQLEKPSQIAYLDIGLCGITWIFLTVSR